MLPRLMTALLIAAAPVAGAATCCAWEISVLNGETRELKHFSPGASTFEIRLDGLRGFKTCKVPPERIFEFEGYPTTRLEVYCYTIAGDVVMAQAVVSLKTDAEVTRFQLLARPVSINAGATETTINSGGYREFMLYCKR